MNRTAGLNGAIFGCILVLSSFATTAVSELPRAGRLPNGKPYRIDAQGVKITDQLAELEVENNDLRRQLVALEEQLNARSSGGVKPAQLVSDCPTCSCPTANSCPPPVVCPVVDCSDSMQPLRDAANSAEKRANNIDLEWQERFNKTAAALISADAELKALKGDLTQAKSRMIELERLLGEEQNKTQRMTQQQSNDTQQARASLDSAPHPVFSPDEMGLTADVPKNKATSVTELQASLREQLNQIQSLIISRKNLLDKVKASRRGVSIQIQPLTSSAGRSLDTLRIVASRSSEANELSTAEAEIKEILHKLQSDIGVLSRLAKL